MSGIHTVNCLGVSTGPVCLDNGQPAYTTSQVSYYNPASSTAVVAPELSYWGLAFLGLVLLGLSAILLRQAAATRS
jgi:hypothetical protein